MRTPFIRELRDLVDKGLLWESRLRPSGEPTSTRLDRNTPACVRVARRRDSLLGLFQRYRPKNNHNRMITGIGTPNSQSRIPRPIVSSSILTREGNAGQTHRFHFGESRMSRGVIFCSLPYGLEGSVLGGRSNQIGTGVKRSPTSSLLFSSTARAKHCFERSSDITLLSSLANASAQCW